MARIFKDCLEMVQEMDRELKVSGITVPVKHYQNKELTGENQNTKDSFNIIEAVLSYLNGIIS